MTESPHVHGLSLADGIGRRITAPPASPSAPPAPFPAYLCPHCLLQTRWRAYSGSNTASTAEWRTADNINRSSAHNAKKRGHAGAHLPTQVPHLEFNVLVLHGFNVETDGGHRGHGLIHLQSICAAFRITNGHRVTRLQLIFPPHLVQNNPSFGKSQRNAAKAHSIRLRTENCGLAGVVQAQYQNADLLLAK